MYYVFFLRNAFQAACVVIWGRDREATKNTLSGICCQFVVTEIKECFHLLWTREYGEDLISFPAGMESMPLKLLRFLWVVL